MDKEKRIYHSQIEVRKTDDGKTIIGHAAVYDSLSENLGGFRERIKPGAFDSVLNDDVRALFNHDSNLVLGRTKSGTLRLSVDEKGLRYDITPPDTTAANDLMILLERGDVDQSSFGFIVEDDSWDEDEDGRMIRTINKFKRLFDVSPVTYPAYPETDVALRRLDEVKEKLDKKQDDEQRSDLLVVKNKLKIKLLNLMSYD